MKKLLVLFTMIWLPLAAWSADGDTFTANTVEGVAMTFKVTSEANKQCQVGTGNPSAVNMSTTGALTIPSVVNGYSMTSIGYGAFYNCSGLTSVTIPNSVTSIGEWAFYGCSGLTSVTIGNSVTSVGGGAFQNCRGLTSITIPNSLTSIGSNAFQNCSGLTSIKVESGNTIYDSRGNCNAIIKTGTNELVAGCKSTIIPNSVTSIGSNAFSGCSGLTSVTIPNSVTSIGQSAFTSCRGLTSIVVESGNTVYDSRDNCNAIIKTKTNELIAGCKNTVIPTSVTRIGENAFCNCSGLTSVTIPNSVTSIGRDAFEGTGWYNNQPYGLLYLDNWLLGYKGKPEGEVIINEGTKGIAGYAFYNCTGLTSVTIPNSVTSIGSSAFSRCI